MKKLPLEAPILNTLSPLPVNSSGINLDRLSPSLRPAGTARGYQDWRSMLFLHWPVPTEQLRPLMPAELSLDLHHEIAYLSIVLFGMEQVRPRWWPRQLALQFLEVNVRTYVHHKGTPGIYFLSLDANSRLAVWGARTAWSLPYHHATMEMTQGREETRFQVRRSGSGSVHRVSYRVGTMLGKSQPGTLEDFLLERYWLFVEHRGRLCKAQVHHRPYLAQKATVGEFKDQLIAAAGLPQPRGDPPLTHYVQGVDTEVFSLRPA